MQNISTPCIHDHFSLILNICSKSHIYREMGASVQMPGQRDGIKTDKQTVSWVHICNHMLREVVWRKNLPGLHGQVWRGGLRGPGPGLGSESPWLCGQGCIGTLCLWPVPGESHYGWVGGKGKMEGVLPDTINLICLFKKNKRQREEQHVSVKTTLVLDNS